MRRLRSSRALWLSGSVVCLAMLTVSVEARYLQKVKLMLPNALPGINSMGNLDTGNTYDAYVKAIINTREERAFIKAHGYVQNDSGRPYYAKDVFLGVSYFGFIDVSDIYRVCRNGRAYVIARAYLQDVT